MGPTLYAHPFSSYCQKVLVALYENGVPFTYRSLDEPGAYADMAALWPLNRFPVLVDEAETLVESSIIIEHLGLRYPGPVRLIPESPTAALTVRFMDRFMDNHIHTHVQKIVGDALREPGEHDAKGVELAHAALDTALDWLETRIDEPWATRDGFSLADCAAAPALFYADWVHPIEARCPRVRAYRARLNARPSVARCIDEARRYRHLFPLGAPDRD